MKLTSVQRYAPAPRRLHRVLSDFDALEGLLMQSGVQILERTPGQPDGTGRSWRLRVRLKGIAQEATATITAVTPGAGYQLEALADGVAVGLSVTIAPVAEGGCEVRAQVEARARGLAGRLILAPLALAQGTLEPKFHDRFVGYTRARLKAARGGSGTGPDA